MWYHLRKPMVLSPLFSLRSKSINHRRWIVQNISWGEGGGEGTHLAGWKPAELGSPNTLRPLRSIVSAFYANSKNSKCIWSASGYFNFVPKSSHEYG